MDEFLNELASMDQLANARNNFAKSMALLRALKAGAVKLDEVTLTADGWQVAAIEPPVSVPEIAAELTETVA